MYHNLHDHMNVCLDRHNILFVNLIRITFAFQVLDRESRDNYIVTVVATDNGTPVSTASTTVSITILDANDNTPTFSKQVRNFFNVKCLKSITIYVTK